MTTKKSRETSSFAKDEQRVAKLVEIIDLGREDKEADELAIELLRKYMSKLAKHPRERLSDSEQEALGMDADDYNRIVYSK
jgi:pyruvate-formate lyase